MLLSATLLLSPLLVSAVSATVKWEKRQQHTYPAADVKGPAPLPAWIATYTAAKAAGLIPAFAPSTLVNGNPSYAAGSNAAQVCSWTLSHCYEAYDVVDAPAGIVGIAFDDGPQLASPPLYQFLQAQKQAATHFMIGSRILDNPSIFQQAIATGGHIAIHTWSHPYMTTMTDMQILGEIGWTAQIIFDQSGLVPAFWRPPYGDIDNRVRAIAKHVFGLYNVIWNQDTFDWCLTEGGGSSCVGAGPGTDAGLDSTLQGFYRGPKSPGLLILEHELTSRSVGGFMRNFPTLKSQGWIPKAIPDIWSVPWYNVGVAVGAGPVVSNSTAAPGASVASSGIPTSAPASRTKTNTVVIVTPTETGALVTGMPVSTAARTSAASSAAASSAAASASSSTRLPSSASRAAKGWSVLAGGALFAGFLAVY